MAQVVMRNRVTGEYRKVEKDSEEFWGVRAELHTDGRPRWEQTGEHDLAAFAARAAAGQVRAEDIGDQDQPVEMVVESGGASTVGLDRGWPTPGELEQKAGRAADMSDDEIAQASALYGGGTIVEGYPAGHPPQVDPDEAEEAGINLASGLGGAEGGPSEEQTERLMDAQGDAVEEQPTPEEDDSGKAQAGSGTSGDVPYTRRSPAQLRTEIEARNATRAEQDQIVPEGTGSTGNVLKSDLIRALQADDSRTQE